MPVLGGACRVLLSTLSCTYTLLQGCRQGKGIQEHNNHKLALTLSQKLGKRGYCCLMSQQEAMLRHLSFSSCLLLRPVPPLLQASSRVQMCTEPPSAGAAEGRYL